MLDKIRIGTSGIPPNFWKSNYSKGKDCRLNMPFWINDVGLNAYEVMYTYGARMREENALILKENALKHNIWLTVHAAYYVVLTSPKLDVQERSKQELLKAVRLANIMQANNVVFHPGYYGEDSEKSFNRYLKNLKEVVKEQNNLPHFEPFANLIKKYKIKPTLISESKNSQDLAGITMKKYLEKINYF